MIEALTEFTVSAQLHDVIACPPLAAVGCNDRAGRGDPPPRLAAEIRRGRKLAFDSYARGSCIVGPTVRSLHIAAWVQ